MLNGITSNAKVNQVLQNALSKKKQLTLTRQLIKAMVKRRQKLSNESLALVLNHLKKKVQSGSFRKK